MRDAHFTRQERDAILWMRVLFVAFFAVGAIFAFHPNYFLNYLDGFGAVFFNFASEPLNPPQFEIWWVLSIALMITLSYLAFMAQHNWIHYHPLVIAIIIAKAISALGFAALAIFHPTHFFYIVAAGVDIVIWLVTWITYAQAVKSRTY